MDLNIFKNLAFLAIGIITGRVLMAIQYEISKPKNYGKCKCEENNSNYNNNGNNNSNNNN